MSLLCDQLEVALKPFLLKDLYAIVVDYAKEEIPRPNPGVFPRCLCPGESWTWEGEMNHRHQPDLDGDVVTASCAEYGVYVFMKSLYLTRPGQKKDECLGRLDSNLSALCCNAKTIFWMEKGKPGYMHQRTLDQLVPVYSYWHLNEQRVALATDSKGIYFVTSERVCRYSLDLRVNKIWTFEKKETTLKKWVKTVTPSAARLVAVQWPYLAIVKKKKVTIYQMDEAKQSLSPLRTEDTTLQDKPHGVVIHENLLVVFTLNSYEISCHQLISKQE